MAELTKEQIESSIYESARHVGIPAEQIDRWIGTMKLCGIDVRAAQSEQAIRQAAMAEARIDNSSWRVFIGSICIAQWIGGNAVVSGNHMVKPEIAAKWLAAKINAEIAGGIAAYGCAQEAKIGEKCVSFCGSDDCPHTLRAASLPAGVAVVKSEDLSAAARKLRLIGGIYDGDKESRRLAETFEKAMIGSAK